VAVKKVFRFRLDEEDILKKILEIFTRIITSPASISIHPGVLSLCSSNFQLHKVLESVINPGMVQDFVNKALCLEYLKLVTVLKIKHISLVPGLARSLEINDPLIIEKVLEETLTQLEFSSLNLEILKNLVVNKTPAFNKLINHCLDQLEHTSEIIRENALKVIQATIEQLPKDCANIVNVAEFRSGKCYLNKYIVEEFEDLLIGDIRVLCKKLLAVVMAEADGEFKDAAHVCLVQIKDKRPLAIAHECVDAKRGGFLKRWEYLDTLLSIPSSS